MDYVGSLHFVRTGETEYSVTFTSRDFSEGAPSAQLAFVTENDLAQFLLDAGFGAQHSDGIQGALHSVGHHTVDDFRISEKHWHRLFQQSAARRAAAGATRDRV